MMAASELAAVLVTGALAAGVSVAAAEAMPRPFGIRVVDEATGRGVPLVQLRTVNQVPFWTDSNGWVAFFEPGLMDREVFFHVSSDGYEFPKDGFGYAGKTLRPVPGGRAEMRLRRLNVAERLYRVTGAGIYRDSVLLGEPVPLREPVINGLVLGQDSVQAAVYQGRVFWLWGDTQRARYPLGHFRTAGATSRLPADGGLDPARGVDLSYVVDREGFSRPMCPMPGTDGMVWMDALAVVPDTQGRDRLAAHYSRMKDLGHRLEHGLAVYDDAGESFTKVRALPDGEPWRSPAGHPIPWREGDASYLLFTVPFPVVRARASLAELSDPQRYEAFTCLKPGSRRGPGALVERDAAGAVVWAWRADTDPVGQTEERDLVKAGQLRPEECRFALCDAETGKPVSLHGGTICHNAYRRRWILIGVEIGGTSFLGEVWYAEADAPTGPWGSARKVVTHAKYSFYNPAQHPFLDGDGGRFVYFEGTYAETFSGNPVPTPRYDYNQIMYRLDLADPRLHVTP